LLKSHNFYAKTDGADFMNFDALALRQLPQAAGKDFLLNFVSESLGASLNSLAFVTERPLNEPPQRWCGSNEFCTSLCLGD
jgi:hypothetical protein